jgi:hypothetical protein
MPILDSRGRVFGRVNLVDAAALLLLLVLAAAGVATYRVFGMPSPEIVKTDPATLRVDGNRRLRIEGRNLRPYLHAYVTMPGQAPAFVDLPTNPNEAAFLVERPDRAEVQLPELGPGSYDLYLYDEGREVAHRPSAFTVVAADTPPPPVPDAAVVDIVVRFDLIDELAAMMKSGDTDMMTSRSWALKPAVLTSIRRLPNADRPIGLQITSAGTLEASLAAPRTRVEGTIRVGVVKAFGGWEYDGRRRIRAGESFELVTPIYVASGLITRVTPVPDLAPERASDRH